MAAVRASQGATGTERPGRPPGASRRHAGPSMGPMEPWPPTGGALTCVCTPHACTYAQPRSTPLHSQQWCGHVNARDPFSEGITPPHHHCCQQWCVHPHAHTRRRVHAYARTTCALCARSARMRDVRAPRACTCACTCVHARTRKEVVTYMQPQRRLHLHLYCSPLVSEEWATPLRRVVESTPWPPRGHMVSHMARIAQVCDLGLFNAGRGEGMEPLPHLGPDLSGSGGPCMRPPAALCGIARGREPLGPPPAAFAPAKAGGWRGSAACAPPGRGDGGLFRGPPGYGGTSELLLVSAAIGSGTRLVHQPPSWTPRRSCLRRPDPRGSSPGVIRPGSQTTGSTAHLTGSPRD